MPNKDFQNGLIVGLSAGSSQVESGNIGYQVKFKVDGEDYYVASCTAGNSVKPPVAPTKPGNLLNSWQDEFENDIVFPYTPSSDITLYSNFKAYSFLAINNDIIAEFKNWSSTTQYRWKNNNQSTAICFVIVNTTYGNCGAYALSTDSVGGVNSIGNPYHSFIYNNTTWYIYQSIKNETSAGDIGGHNRFAFFGNYTGSTAGVETCARQTLDLYFNGTPINSEPDTLI